MKKLIKFILTFTGLLAAVVGTWFLRGATYNLNQVNIVNTLNKDVNVRIIFPSEETHEFKLKKHLGKSFKVRKTGEGGITIFVDDKKLNCDSYVTSYNQMIILTITENEVIYNMHFKK